MHVICIDQAFSQRTQWKIGLMQLANFGSGPRLQGFVLYSQTAPHI